MPKGFKNMKAKAKQKATNYAAKKIYGADVIEAVAQDWWAPRLPAAPLPAAPLPACQPSMRRSRPMCARPLTLPVSAFLNPRCVRG
jgi:hypothetical protein